MTIEFKLSYSEKEKDSISSLMEEIYQDELSNLEPVQEGRINISTLYIYDLGSKLEAKVIIRNPLETNINFDKASLLILNSENSVILDEEVDLKDLGIIPSKHARPYSILFNKSHLNCEVNNFENCKVILNNILDNSEAVKLENIIVGEDIDLINVNHIKDYVSKLPPINVGDVNLTCLKLFVDDCDKKNFILLIINGNENTVNVQNFTIGLKNAFGAIIGLQPVRESIEAPQFSVKAVKIPFNEENLTSPIGSVSSVELFILPNVS